MPPVLSGYAIVGVPSSTTTSGRIARTTRRRASSSACSIEVVEGAHGRRDQADRPGLVGRERGTGSEPGRAHRLRAVDHGLLATWHAADQKAGVPAARIGDRGDPAREVEEQVRRGDQAGGREHASERLARLDPSA